ncbi:MAG: deoxyribodipyrimidine photolyase [Gammaproteobacteria bacterium HGW-Gammaproteobacteria-3]|jgi:deoxyribodipyrimidine photo-lyase|nr:MAG: deoxyribodipyrimidine photolyase [Gammaproteobacteria bacterium HGW-Gammaproteobacteria-3]
MKRYSKSLFIFRRDLRLIDNTAFNAALAQSTRVMVAFIFDPRQIEAHPYQSSPALQFMLEALKELRSQLSERGGELFSFNDFPENVIAQIHQDEAIEAVFINRDYTPFSRQRDCRIQQQCQQLNLDFHSFSDVLLTEPNQVLKADHKPYQVFTPFYNRARQYPVALPQPLISEDFIKRAKTNHDPQLIDAFKKPHTNILSGGRNAALAVLTQLERQKDYSTQRDFPALAATTGLSAYLKFGCCSVREVFYAIVTNLGCEHTLLKQLYWRDFFTHIAWHFPHVFKTAFHRQYDNLPWLNKQDDFWAWAEGRTGFPIVDAGLRELNQTGFMHNRVRMVTASFLIKDLHISWRWGERYFARHLVDYDPCINNGNWQWAASTGCDAQPYFRVFNPWLQQKKFDADALYIKKWLPELRSFPAAIIHQWYKKPQPCDYPAPMLDHGERSRQIKAVFKNMNS